MQCDNALRKILSRCDGDVHLLQSLMASVRENFLSVRFKGLTVKQASMSPRRQCTRATSAEEATLSHPSSCLIIWLSAIHKITAWVY